MKVFVVLAFDVNDYESIFVSAIYASETSAEAYRQRLLDEQNKHSRRRPRYNWQIEPHEVMA